MTGTIQKATPRTTRRAFLEHAAELYGIPLEPADLDDLDDDGLADVTALSRAFPQLSDAERSEALWALVNFAE